MSFKVPNRSDFARAVIRRWEKFTFATKNNNHSSSVEALSELCEQILNTCTVLVLVFEI